MTSKIKDFRPPAVATGLGLAADSRVLGLPFQGHRVEKQEEGGNRVESDGLWNLWPLLNSGKRREKKK